MKQLSNSSVVERNLLFLDETGKPLAVDMSVNSDWIKNHSFGEKYLLKIIFLQNSIACES